VAPRSGGAHALPGIECPAELGPILALQSAYRMIAALSILRGFDPDPPGESQQDHGDALMRTALTGSRVLTPSGVRTDCAVILNGARIEALVAPDDPGIRDARVEDLKGQLLSPGLIDTQVNGGGGVLFKRRAGQRLDPCHRRCASAVRHHGVS